MHISRRIKTIAAGALLVLVGSYFTLAALLIRSTEPTFTRPLPPDPQRDAAFMESLRQDYPCEQERFAARDRQMIAARRFGRPDARTTIVLLHGVLSSSFPMNRTAGMLQEATGAEVLALDFRGHGDSDGRPGDVDYIDQYADDVSDVVAAVRRRKPAGRIVLAGHSMGGGIALRYGLRAGTAPVDGLLLFAPHLGATSPTVTAKQPPAPSPDAVDFVHVHGTRTLGLIMLNVAGIRFFNDLPTLFFNLPPELPLRQYTFRSMASMAPDDYRAALRRVRPPLLVLVGADDEVFESARFQEVVTGDSAGRVVIIPGANHDGVCRAPAAISTARDWLIETGLIVRTPSVVP